METTAERLAQLDTVSLTLGVLLGVIGGLILGYVIWRRNSNQQGMMQDIRWSQLVGAILAATALIIGAPETVTIAFIALIPAENIAVTVAEKLGTK